MCLSFGRDIYRLSQTARSTVIGEILTIAQSTSRSILHLRWVKQRRDPFFKEKPDLYGLGIFQASRQFPLKNQYLYKIPFSMLGHHLKPPLLGSSGKVLRMDIWWFLFQGSFWCLINTYTDSSITHKRSVIQNNSFVFLALIRLFQKLIFFQSIVQDR